MMSMPPSSIGGGASGGLNLIMAKPFQQQQHTLNSPGTQDANVDVHGRFQIQRSIQNQNMISNNSKGGGHNAPSSGPAHSMGGGQTSHGFGNQSKVMMQNQSQPHPGTYHGGSIGGGRPQSFQSQQYNAGKINSINESDFAGVDQEEGNLEDNFSQLSMN